MLLGLLGWMVFRREVLLCREVLEPPGKTLLIPVPAGKSLPDLPASGIDVAASKRGLNGARLLNAVRSPLDPTPRNMSSSTPNCSAIFSGYHYIDRRFVAKVWALIPYL